MSLATSENKINFVVIRDDWSEYKIKDDGLTVKVRMSLTELIDTGIKKGKASKLKFGTKASFFKEPNPEDKGEPSENPKISDEDIMGELEFEKIREPLNIYDVPDKFLIILRSSLDKIKKTSKFDANGKRIYQFGVENALNVVPYPKMK